MTNVIEGLVEGLARQSQENLRRAYADLGAEPTGKDLLIKPKSQGEISDRWLVEGISPAGKAFLDLLADPQPYTNRTLLGLKRLAGEWGLGLAYELDETREPLCLGAVQTGAVT